MSCFQHPQLAEVSLTTVLNALGDPVRLDIVRQLSEQKEECAWGDIQVPVNKATLSHHMKTLRQAGIIWHRKEGTRCYIKIRPELQERFPGLLSNVLVNYESPHA